MKPQQASSAPQAIEWIFAALSAALVLFMLGFLLVEGLTNAVQIPVLSIVAGQAEQMGAAFEVPFLVRNDGEATAASVLVEAVVSPGSPSEQRSEVTLDYVPARSTTEGGFVFTEDPRGLPLQVRVLGYQDP